ncbi:MAG TPA: hypothetical protein VG097_14250, partial [Gemmata sp.]|nr:hypothetical protein [Gemmata sp.]
MSFAITLTPPPRQVREELSTGDDAFAQLAWLDKNLKEMDDWLDTMGEKYRLICEIADQYPDDRTIPEEIYDSVRCIWTDLCSLVVTRQNWLAHSKQLPPSQFRKMCIAGDSRHIERLAELIRTIAVVWQDLELTVPDEIADSVWTIRISPLAYLRAMWNLFWSSVRHPFTLTTIELNTGRI